MRKTLESASFLIAIAYGITALIAAWYYYRAARLQNLTIKGFHG